MVLEQSPKDRTPPHLCQAVALSAQHTSHIFLSSLLFMFPDMLVVNTFTIDKSFWLVDLAQMGAGGQYVNRQQAWGFFSQGTFLPGLSLNGTKFEVILTVHRR